VEKLKMPVRPADFYEIQRRQKGRSLLVFLVLVVFYSFAVGFIALAFIWGLGLFLVSDPWMTGRFPTIFPAAVLTTAVLIAWIHFHDARKNGAAFIFKRLQASPAELSDIYHRRFANAVEEIRIAAGLPRVIPYVIPCFAINSMALVGSDGVPCVAVTEGLLADCTRDELQAVAAHELAHVARGDTFYLTLVCSLANAFEKLRGALEPEKHEPGHKGRGGSPGRAGPVLAYLAVSLSALIMHLLSTLVSRERELLADAAAVELCRNPAALARAIARAHIKNSFVGDFSLSYTPLFIVPPDSREIRQSRLSRAFNSHPPLMARIQPLAAMARKTPDDIFREIREIHSERESARNTISEALPETSSEQGEWMIQNDSGLWEGPFEIADLLTRPDFSFFSHLKNTREGLEAMAREFPQIRIAQRLKSKKRGRSLRPKGSCPRCRTLLHDIFYEGVRIQTCRDCRGRLVPISAMDRLIARREAAFTEDQKIKAAVFEREVVNNPRLRRKNRVEEGLECPGCGHTMLSRPYSYQDILPVDKCLSCHRIWFDADELEILQILIEDRTSREYHPANHL
jgi:Zn-dependent protease with chaperone function/Zn-finger nucleic acid-binding protein